MILKALSLRQPWAWLVIHGGKDIENRRWNTRLRGPILLHAAKGMTRDEYLDAVHFARGEGFERPLPSFTELDRGGLVGATTITGVLPPHDDLIRIAKARRWHMPAQHGFILGPRVALPFRALKGELEFFSVELTTDEERVLRREGLIP